jgi:integrase
MKQSIMPALAAFWGDRPWTDLTLPVIREYRRQRVGFGPFEGRPVKATTRNRDIKRLKAIVNWACKEGLIPLRESPIADIPDEAVRDDRDFHPSEEDFATLLRHCQPILLRSMLIVAFETAMRRDEFRKLEWTEVAPGGEFVLLPPHRHKAGRKTKKPRIIPLSSLALEVIRRQGRTSRYVFPHHDGQPVPRATLGGWFRRARKASGLKGPHDQELWIHSMRKSFGSLSALGGMPSEMAMSMAGWSDQRTADIYRSMSKAHLEAARGHLDARLKNPALLLSALSAPLPDDD